MNGYCTVGRSYMLSLLGVRVKGLRVLFVLQSKWTIPTVPSTPSLPPPPSPPPLVFIVEIPWSLNYLWSIFHFRSIAIFFVLFLFFGFFGFFFFSTKLLFILGCDNLAQCQDSCRNYAAYLTFILVSNTEFHQPITPQHQYEFSPNYMVPTWRIHLTIKAS